MHRGNGAESRSARVYESSLKNRVTPTTGSAIYLLIFKKKKKYKVSNKSTGRSGGSSAIKLC